MPALGILTCEILELEFAHLLISDPEISRVTVVEEDYSQALTALLDPIPLSRTGDSDLAVLLHCRNLNFAFFPPFKGMFA